MQILSPLEALPYVRRDADGRAHLIGLSGGKDSTCLALLLMERRPDVPFTFACTPTGNELPEMIAHWRRLAEIVAPAPMLFIQAKQAGQPITLESLIDGFGALPNHRMRWCTRKLKIEPWAAFMRGLMTAGPVRSYIGLRADEEERRGMFGDDLDVVFPLREYGFGLPEVLAYLDRAGVCIPRRTDCAWCYEQSLVEWKVLAEQHPEIYATGIEIEERHGATFRSPSRDTWPADLRSLRVAFASDRKLRGEEKYRRGIDACRVCRL